MPTDRIDYASKSFAQNRQIAEKNLMEAREHARTMRAWRRRRDFGLGGLHLWVFYPFDIRKLYSYIREMRWKVSFYRKVERDLANGDLASAIEALSVFAPREETPREVVRRVMRNPPTLSSILQSPTALRHNMLMLRDDLIKAQTEQRA